MTWGHRYKKNPRCTYRETDILDAAVRQTSKLYSLRKMQKCLLFLMVNEIAVWHWPDIFTVKLLLQDSTYICRCHITSYTIYIHSQKHVSTPANHHTCGGCTVLDVCLTAATARHSSLIGCGQLSEIWVVCQRGDDVSDKGFRESSSCLIRQRWGTFVSSDSSGKQQQQQHGASDQPECRRYRRNADGGRLRGHPADAGVSRWWVEKFNVMGPVQRSE